MTSSARPPGADISDSEQLFDINSSQSRGTWPRTK